MSKAIQLHDASNNYEPKGLEQNRPQKLLTVNQNYDNQKWLQCKILGKNILIRSYSAACVYKSQLYIYGGFQILNGILSDFQKINLDESQEKFQWNQVQVNNKKKTPGPRAKHALNVYQNKIYLIGGIKSLSQICNDIYSFDIEKGIWQSIQPKGVSLPRLESFGSVLHQDRIIIIGGYNGQKCEYSNSVYEYNISTNTISLLYSHKKNAKNEPTPRSGCAIASDGKDIFMFGGKDQQNRFNDLWLFNMETYQYIRIQDKSQLRPFVRNGHTMNYFEGRLYIFGGIHQVTWQLDDLHIYNIKKNQWTTLQIDSARRKQYKSINIEKIQTQKKNIQNNNPPQQKTHTKVTAFSPKSKIDLTQHFKQQLSESGGQNQQHIPYASHSPGKMIDQQRKKVFLHKKAQMLKPFEISQKQKGRYINIQPTSQAMKNSLDIIGNPNPKVKHHNLSKLTDFGKTSCSKFLQPLSNNSNVIVGKKPCARDGHNSVLINTDLIIFGGDRHQMSFNDLYKLNMRVVKKFLEQIK